MDYYDPIVFLKHCPATEIGFGQDGSGKTMPGPMVSWEYCVLDVRGARKIK